MNKIDELKKIIASQKTIRTTRLDKYIKEIERMYIQQGQKINRQTKEVNNLIEKYKRVKQ